MPRPKTKDYKAVTVRMDTEVFNKLEEFCAASGQPKTVAVERALEMYINDYNRKQDIILHAEKP